MELVLYHAVTWYFRSKNDNVNYVISLHNKFFTLNLNKNKRVYRLSIQGTNQAQIHTGFHSFTEISWIFQNDSEIRFRDLKNPICVLQSIVLDPLCNSFFLDLCLQTVW